MKGHCHEIFQPYFFMILTHVGLLFVSNRIFEYGFDFTEIFETKVRKFFCVTATKDQARQMLMNRIFMSSLSYGNLFTLLWNILCCWTHISPCTPVVSSRIRPEHRLRCRLFHFLLCPKHSPAVADAPPTHEISPVSRDGVSDHCCYCCYYCYCCCCCCYCCC